MHFHVSRSGQTYGPYTLDDLHRYVASGNILPGDLAKSEGMTDWLPVSQILAESPDRNSAQNSTQTPPQPLDPPFTPTGTQPNPAFGFQPGPTSFYNSNFAPAGGTSLPNAALASQFPDAPNLHWGLYTLFTVLTCSLFSKVMVLVQSAWLKRVQPNSQALLCYIVTLALVILRAILNIAHRTGSVVNYTSNAGGFKYDVNSGIHDHPFTSLLLLLWLIMFFVSRFVMRASLEEHFNTAEPIGLRLNPVMTFFFGGIYHQYHLNRINALKQMARMNAPRY